MGRRALGLAGLVVVVGILALVLVQLIAPGIAEQRLRDRLGRSGQVRSVHVSAFPAVELLFGHADTVSVALDSVRTGPSSASGLVALTRATGSLDVVIARLAIGPLALTDVRLRKDDRGELMARAHLAARDLAAAVPPGLSVAPVASGGGQLLLRGQISAFGLSASANAVLCARDGRLVLVPDVPFGGLATVTVYGDPRVQVDGVAAQPDADGFELSASAHLGG